MTKWRWLLIVIAGGLLVVTPLLPIGSDDNLTLLISVFTIAGLAASWNIVAGFAGQINLGHAAFFGIGSLVTRQLWLNNDVPFVISFLGRGRCRSGGGFTGRHTRAALERHLLFHRHAGAGGGTSADGWDDSADGESIAGTDAAQL